MMSESLSPDFSARITVAIDKLRQLVRRDVQTLWCCSFEDLPIVNNCCPPIDPETWQPVQLNEKGYIVWEAGRKICWLAQRLVIPRDLQGYPLAGLALRFVLVWWADNAKIFVNRQWVQEGDLFESSVRILLTEAAIPGEEITVALRLVSPGHDIGGLMRSRLVYESFSIQNPPDPGFVADELAVLQQYWQAFEPEKLPLLAAELENINWDAVGDATEFNASLATLRHNLQPHAARIKQRCIKMLSHAHLDMAWLWEVEETWDAAQRTFESVLNLQKDFPDLTFCHTSPALYEWVEKHRPDLFAAIQDAASRQSWEVLGGMWVEPDVNLVAGESIIRQLLYGQRYTREKFGKIAKVAWLTDSFGFCWQLPQILTRAGIEFFVTQKLHWNDTTKFPHGAFWWQSPNGSQIFTLMSPPNIEGVMDTNPITITSYAVNWELQTGLKEIFWLPGVGDRGGGPSRDMLEVQQRWRQSPFFPRIEFTTAREYLQGIETSLQHRESQTVAETENLQLEVQNPEIPLWNDELYLEFHRGCYTTHADQKRYNRRCEALLYQAELWSTFANIISRGVGAQCLRPQSLAQNGKGGFSQQPIEQTSNFCTKLASTLVRAKHLVYKATRRVFNRSTKCFAPTPQSKIENAWKKVLFNQFHDILPGTSIPEVFVQANREWEEAIAIAENILQEALGAIASRISLPSPPHPNAKPLIIFNSLNWTRSEVIEIPLSESNWEIYDADGQKLPSQQTDTTLLFLAKDIPSIGYRLFWLCQATVKAKHLENKLHRRFSTETPNALPLLENQTLQVAINPQTGDISSIFDKLNQREILNGAGNQLQAFKDEGQYWDAWNIDPNYQQHPLPPTQLKSIEWIERGDIRQRLRVIRQFNASQFTQDYILDTHSSILKIATTVDWQERHVLVKAAFPLNLEADFATTEIPCGAIQRTTKPQTPAERAKWEVPVLQWVDLTESIPNPYGVSLLNDSQYGCDVQPSQLRLTLLRGSMWPHADADQGIHQLTYAIYPHADSWQSAQTVRKGYEFNQPLQVVSCDRDFPPLQQVLKESNPQVPLNKENLGSSNYQVPLNKENLGGSHPTYIFSCSQLEHETPKTLPPTTSFLDLSAENLILIAFKPAEDNPDACILRCYECHGDRAELSLRSALELNLDFPVDLLEQPLKQDNEQVSVQFTEVQPWEIVSFYIS